jgi:nitrite reductase/ring-hydroxylating ferredoxin subunit
MVVFHKVATLDEVKPGQAKDVVVGDELIAIYNVNGKIFATSDICLHAGGSLGQGELCDGVITCPLHGWQYEVESGKCMMVPAMKLKTYQVKVEGNGILVGIGESS